MALERFGFIVSGRRLDPAVHRTQLQSPAFHMQAVGVARPDQAEAVAREMVAQGVQLIELCGGFAPADEARVQQAIAHAVPIGTVRYGPEAIDALHALFAR